MILIFYLKKADFVLPAETDLAEISCLTQRRYEHIKKHDGNVVFF